MNQQSKMEKLSFFWGEKNEKAKRQLSVSGEHLVVSFFISGREMKTEKKKLCQKHGKATHLGTPTGREAGDKYIW